jgi:hypothetical protein
VRIATAASSKSVMPRTRLAVAPTRSICAVTRSSPG